MATQRVCGITDCGKPHEARGLCNYHYRKLIDIEERGSRYAPKGAARAFVLKALKMETDECIIWPFTMDKDSYGVHQWEGKQWGAHRLLCFLKHGEPPPNNMARHSCRRRACINPRHLSWGTGKDNMDDREAHGMTRKGERVHSSKLTAKAVREIRSAPPSVSHNELARRFGVTGTCVQYARVGRTWKHIV